MGFTPGWTIASWIAGRPIGTPWLNFITLPEILKQGGYKTALIGKYHLGDPSDNAEWI